jgi:hypothetical protein
MGYRSNVTTVITVENKKNFKKYLKELKELKDDESMKELIDDAEFTDNGVDGIRLSWESIKWYNCLGSYPEIIAFENWLDKIAEDEDTSYHFVRIGEDLDDVEERIEGDPKYWVYIERRLETDF